MSIETLHTDSDGDALFFERWNGGQFLGVQQGGDEYIVKLDREGAVSVISRLTNYVQEVDDAERTAQLAADVATAKALEIGTRVRISESPVQNRDGKPANYAEHFAGQTGTVARKIDGRTFGVGAGRVRVHVPDAVSNWNSGETDIHVSSLTVLPPEPAFSVGDRVEVFGRAARFGSRDGWDGPGRVVAPGVETGGWVYIKPDAGPHAGVTGVFNPNSVRRYHPDYAAIAAQFKPGDLALVGDKPGVHADGRGWVDPAFRGKAVNVVAPDSDASTFGSACVHVALGNGDTNYVHVAHLTKAVAVPA